MIIDQNLGLGVIYGTVPSEFDYRNQFAPKIVKTSAQIASKKYWFFTMDFYRKSGQNWVRIGPYGMKEVEMKRGSS